LSPWARSFSIYAAVGALSVAAVLNPFVAGSIWSLSPSRTAYLQTLDGGLAAIFALCLLHLWTRRRVFLPTAVAAIAALPVLMVAAELALSYANVARHADDEARGPDLLHRLDPRLGWSIKPDFESRHVQPGKFDVIYRSDHKGRKAIPQAQGVEKTLHFFGDSFIFGHGVANEDTALNLLAARLRDRFNVQNYGVMGYGLDQMLVRLQDSLDEIGPGDVVIFAPTSWDLDRNLIVKASICWPAFHYQRDLSRLPLWRDGRWAFVPAAEACGFVEGLLMVASDLPLGMLYQRYRARVFSGAVVEHSDDIFAAASRFAAGRGARFLLIFLLDANQCRTGRFEEPIERLTTPFVTLAAHCPKDPARLAALSHPHGVHWSREGNRWAARALEAVLTAKIPELRQGSDSGLPARPRGPRGAGD